MPRRSSSRSPCCHCCRGCPAGLISESGWAARPAGTVLCHGCDPGPSSEDATASTLRTGSFRLYFEGERWEWSPEAAQIHGHDPVPMTLTTEQVMSYKHPDDRARIWPIWSTCAGPTR